MLYIVVILAFIVAIGVLVSVHEFGHFWVARRLGFKVLRFSIGFGRPLLRWRGPIPTDIEYWLSSIPLGGYVKMLDEREGPVATVEQPSRVQSAAVPAAHRACCSPGPAFNFLFAIVAYWVMFATGVPGIKPMIGAVAEDSVAAQRRLASRTTRFKSVGGRADRDLGSTRRSRSTTSCSPTRASTSSVRSSSGATQERRARRDAAARRELTEPARCSTGSGSGPAPRCPR